MLVSCRISVHRIDARQRIKGAIDDRIKEEQARQAKAQQTGRAPARRRPQQDGSAPRVQSRQRESSTTPAGRGPDPADFAIADDEGTATSQVTTPLPQQEGTNGVEEEKVETLPDGQEPPSGSSAHAQLTEDAPEKSAVVLQDLPAEVKTRLRRLDKLESKYAELLKAYRAAHARVQYIEPFEATLRESTPLASIADPSALSEYLNQINTKSGMVLEELKRVSGERDDFKRKFEAADADTKRLEDDLNALKRQSEDIPKAEPVLTAPTEPNDASASTKDEASSVASPRSVSSRIPSLSIFSPKSRPKTEVPATDASEDLFSFDSEVPKLEAQLNEHREQVDDLTQQVHHLKNDLKVARESTEGMVETLEARTRELNLLRDSKEKSDLKERELEEKIEKLESEAQSSESSTQQTEELVALRAELESTKLQLSSAEKRIQVLEDESRQADKQLKEAKESAGNVQLSLEEEKRANLALHEKVQQKDNINKDLEDSLAFSKKSERDHQKTAKHLEASEKKVQAMQGVVENLRTQLSQAEITASELQAQVQLCQQKDPATALGALSAIPTTASPQDDTATSSKKKNKKKKKTKAANTTNDVSLPDQNTVQDEDLGPVAESGHAGDSTTSALSELTAKISQLETELEEKNATIETLKSRIKDQESLQEEIETLRDDLLHQGEEHVEARDALKTARTEKQLLQVKLDEIEKQLSDAQKELKSGGEAATNHQLVLEDLQTKTKASEDALRELEGAQAQVEKLQTDLTAAEQLASSRFKDITDLKDLLGKSQPELRGLRKEVEDLKGVKDELKNKSGEMSRLESKHEEVKTELKNLGKRLSSQDTEIKGLKSKVETETKLRERAEGEIQMKESELRSAEARRNGAVELHESTKADLKKAREEMQALQAKLRDLNEQISSYERQITGLKEEVSLKTALHSSSQGLVQSLRDQMHELNVQTREMTGKSESMEEELAETQRMLSERTRESQTMRMLLNSAESGTEARVREMKERMDAAIEERDRLEDEHSVSSRRMARDVDDAKNKAREAQRQLKILEAEKEDLEARSREWRKLREDFEYSSKAAEREVEETRNAMKGLREALEDSEKQIRDIEAQRADIRRQAEEAQERLDKLNKANRNLTEEVRTLQLRTGTRPSVRPGIESGMQSSRTSIDSSTARSPAPPTSRAGLSSNTSLPRSETPTTAPGAGAGLSSGTVDYVYLKNVLLQFLSQKDKGHQRQLIPVIGMLLHFDDKDQQRWNAAVAAR